ncbi:pentapeptide repeat-containing protein [Christiangramia gaetbulicola]|uniref:pentapeptide repeat-containing protein n=1 Tax=Christiangramia gaetbulicola TaxID=703340 RepID=UPI001474E431|nr:pentapeptide repeat-containing protein [Christiangramia gaetbulicola]
MEDYEGLLYFDRCTFNSFVDLANTNFHSKIRFRQCIFHGEVYFNNTTFHDLADFWRCKFEKRTSFFKTDFLATTVFSGSIFKENALFTYSQIEKLLILRRTTFIQGLDLSLANINGDLKLFDIQLDDFKSVDNMPETIEYEEGLEEKGEIYTANKRETFRLIKHIFQSNNDSVTSQKFSLLESITHRKEIWFRLNHDFRSKDLWDYILLTLNRFSNNHKTSYIRGFAFTIFLGLFTFIFVAWSSKTYEPATNFDQFDFGLAVSHFVQFLTPTHKFDYIDENPSGQFYLLDFLGRIIIAYGIYQTIQAFRKFR